MNLHDRMTPAESFRLEEQARLVCAHCRQPATREDVFGAMYVRHTFDSDAYQCTGPEDPDWIWLAPTIGGFRMETP